jgi:hypothetical protein
MVYCLCAKLMGATTRELKESVKGWKFSIYPALVWNLIRANISGLCACSLAVVAAIKFELMVPSFVAVSAVKQLIETLSCDTLSALTSVISILAFISSGK